MSTTTTSRPKAPAPARPAQTYRHASGGQRLGRSGAGSDGWLIAPGPHGPGHAGRAGPGRRQAGPPVAQLAHRRRPRRNLGSPERSGAVPAIYPSEAARSGSIHRTTLMSTTTTSRPKAPAPARPAQTYRHASGGQRLGRSGAGSGGRLIAPGPHGPGHAGRAGPGRRQAGPPVPQLARGGCPRRNFALPERFGAVPAIHPSEAARSGSTDRTTLTMSTRPTARLKAPAPDRQARTQRHAHAGQRLGRSGAGSGGRLTAPGPHWGDLAGRADPGRREAGPPVDQLARFGCPRRNLGSPERSGALPAIYPSEAARSGPTDRTTLTMSTTTTSRPKAPAPAHLAHGPRPATGPIGPADLLGPATPRCERAPDMDPAWRAVRGTGQTGAARAHSIFQTSAGSWPESLWITRTRSTTRERQAI